MFWVFFVYLKGCFFIILSNNINKKIEFLQFYIYMPDVMLFIALTLKKSYLILSEGCALLYLKLLKQYLDRNSPNML